MRNSNKIVRQLRRKWGSKKRKQQSEIRSESEWRSNSSMTLIEFHHKGRRTTYFSSTQLNSTLNSTHKPKHKNLKSKRPNAPTRNQCIRILDSWFLILQEHEKEGWVEKKLWAQNIFQFICIVFSFFKINVLLLSKHRSLAILVKLILRYFVLFGAILNQIF